MKRLVFLIFINLAATAFAQDTTIHKLQANGYLSFMQSAMDLNLSEKKVLWESLLHNRLNFDYTPSENISFSLQMRNRLIAGDRLNLDEQGDYIKSLAGDPGIVDFSGNVFTGKAYVFNMAVDRLWMKYARNKLEITLGRQRVNWGLSYVWNPNDWFNNYSFFDVDYTERPGSDALRIQYFTGALSGMEAVVKIDSARDITVAGLFKGNFRSFDFQILGGLLSEKDLALGFGWAGDVSQIGFRGEMCYLHPARQVRDTSDLLLISVALDYTFSNSLMIQGEFFYNKRHKRTGEDSFLGFYSRPSSVKDLSFTEINLFGQASYPISPLISGSMSVLYFPEVKGWYLGPAITYSLGNNLELAFFLQYFTGEFPDLSGVISKTNYVLGFGRVKWNF